MSDGEDATAAHAAEPEWWRRAVDNPDAVVPLLPVGSRPPVSAPAAQPSRSGILNVAKPRGPTSHDVVQAIRRASGERRVGHAGTLDPLASGVLVVCLGSATRVVEEIQASPKRYLARVRLGVTTTTYDAEGAIVHAADPGGVTRMAVEAALGRFRGDILQVPPMYAALKHDGQRLYHLARQGIEVPRAPRPVTVHELVLRAWEPPDVVLAMQVSSGTYVRSIAHDLGEALGVGAHLATLERTAVGPFRLTEAESLERLIAAFAEGWWAPLLHPLDAALLGYSALIVDDPAEQAIRNGQQVEGPPPDGGVTPLVRAYNHQGQFIALLKWDTLHGLWQPDRVFPRAG